MQNQPHFDTNSPSLVIYYDGLCVLCNGFIRWILKLDRQEKFFFAPLQHAPEQIQNLAGNQGGTETIVLYKNGDWYSHSDAIIEIGKSLGGIHSMIKITGVFPKNIRDYCYLFIAKRRYRLFGKYGSCPVPSASTKKRFLHFKEG